MTNDDLPQTTEVTDYPTVLERAMVTGDLAKLKPMERLLYYKAVCESLGLNPLTKPFDYINLNGKLTLYPKKDATDQLRSIHGISITGAERDMSDVDAATWNVTAMDRTGRTDVDTGSVSIRGLDGEKRANAIMKALTKAKRRVTLSLAGLGWIDETEAEEVGEPVEVDDAGNVIEGPAKARPKGTQMLLDRMKAARAPQKPAEAEDVSEAVYTEDAAPGPSDAPTEPSHEVEPTASGEDAASDASQPSQGLDSDGATAICGAEDAKLETGVCTRAPGHTGAHRSESSAWPQAKA